MVHVLGHIVLEFFAKRLKLILGVVVVALKLCQLLKFAQGLLGDGVVVESALHHPLLELLIFGITQPEISCGSYSGMLGDIIHHIIEHHLHRVDAVEIHCDIGHRIGFHLDVGLYSSTISHLAPVPCIKYAREAVGDIFLISSAAVLIVDGLYATPAGDVVVTGSHLEIAVVGNIDRHLHESLAIGACA